MKKVLLESFAATMLIEILGGTVRVISYALFGCFPLAKRLAGGEWSGWRGFGLMLNKTFPLSSPEHPVSGSAWISFDPSSLLFTLLTGFILSLIILFIVHLDAKKD